MAHAAEPRALRPFPGQLTRAPRLNGGGRHLTYRRPAVAASFSTLSRRWQEAQDLLPTTTSYTSTGRRAGSIFCRAAEEGREPVGKPGTAADWNATTEKLVSAATVIFLFLLVPQIVKNATNLLVSDLAALSAIAWVGYLTALLGNVILLSYFLDRGETPGARVQAIGAATNIVVLAQVYLAACMPPAVFFAAAAFMAAAAAVNGLKFRGALEGGRASVWTAWLDLLGLIGVSALCQALANTFAGAESSLPGLAGLAAAAALLFLDRSERLPAKWRGLWRSVPAWSATLLFAFQPVAQLVRNLTAPESLAGLSLATVFLGMAGNGLMVPRALLTRDAVWLAGSGWAGFMGWCQLVSLFLGRTADGGRYLGAPALLAATAAYFAFNAVALREDLRAKRLPPTPASLGRLLE